MCIPPVVGTADQRNGLFYVRDFDKMLLMTHIVVKEVERLQSLKDMYVTQIIEWLVGEYYLCESLGFIGILTKRWRIPNAHWKTSS